MRSPRTPCRRPPGAAGAHVTGSLVDNGSRLTLDVHTAAGKGATGRLSREGLAFELTRVGDAVHVKGSDARRPRVRST
jgi:hypothetical protein